MSPRSGRKAVSRLLHPCRPLRGLAFFSGIPKGFAKAAPPWATLSRPLRGLKMSKLQWQVFNLPDSHFDQEKQGRLKTCPT